ncbi:MAG: ATP-binding protein [Rickettsiales bacterium]|nr:ATP-binding protein [Rickettsiales bacterium]
MINRPEYIQQLMAFKDKKIGKILSGVRRSGKSTIFALYQEDLRKNGVRDHQIQTINLEDVDNEHLLNYKTLYEHVKKHLVLGEMNYVFLDEVQKVKDFQKTARSLLDKDNVDLYMTGSNSKMLSGEWATSLAGRYVEIHVLPLSFKEYVSYINSGDAKQFLPDLYNQYTEFGSFPQAVVDFMGASNNKPDGTKIIQFLQGIYSTIVLKDVSDRQKEKGISINLNVLENIMKFMSGNIGNITSPNNIANTMTSNGTAISTPTIDSYLKAFCDSYIIYKVGRYDVKGKKALQTLDKYYLVDMGLRYMLIGNKKDADGYILENIVYLELLRRGYNISVGKITKRAGGENKTIEVDFVAQKPGGVIEYYQVAWSVLGNEETLKREYAPLEEINDNYPKFLLTMDLGNGGQNGIKRLNVLNWLMGAA